MIVAVKLYNYYYPQEYISRINHNYITNDFSFAFVWNICTVTILQALIIDQKGTEGTKN